MDEKIGRYEIDKESAGNLTKVNHFDAGLDIRASENVTVWPCDRAIVSTGLKIAIPNGFVGLLWSRSGMSAKNGIEVGAGCIDATYRGEVKVVLYNHSDSKYEVKKGDRIAQLLTVPVMLAPYIGVDKLDETARNENGFGSTGVK